MKKLYRLYGVIILIHFSCDSENAMDCVKKSGDTVTNVVSVDPFDKIRVYNNINLILKNGPEIAISIEGGKNLLHKVDFEVLDNILVISNDNNCNWVRSYRDLNVVVTHPGISDIYLQGYGILSSYGTLDVHDLRIIVDNSSSDIDLKLTGNRLTITSNYVSNIYLSGNLNQLDVQFYNNDGILFARNLNVDNINFEHWGTNSMKVSPSQLLSGEIRSFGNVELFSNPKVIEVEYLGDGQVIKVD